MVKQRRSGFPTCIRDTYSMNTGMTRVLAAVAALFILSSPSGAAPGPDQALASGAAGVESTPKASDLTVATDRFATRCSRAR